MVKITVLHTGLNRHLWREYISEAPAPCPFFKEGQVFEVTDFAMPPGFCTWAWQDIFYAFHTLWNGGNHTPWYKNSGVCVVCCTDATRPVTFKLQRLPG